jgi:hypothetical protein
MKARPRLATIDTLRLADRLGVTRARIALVGLGLETLSAGAKASDDLDQFYGMMSILDDVRDDLLAIGKAIHPTTGP